LPKIDIISSGLGPEDKRRFAKGLARWFARAGSNPYHVISRFSEERPDDIFAGPVPFAAPIASGGADGRFAFVTCKIAETRSSSFRAEAAAEIARLLEQSVPRQFIFVEVVPVREENFFLNKSAEAAS